MKEFGLFILNEKDEKQSLTVHEHRAFQNSVKYIPALNLKVRELSLRATLI